MKKRILIVLILLVGCSTALAQNYSGDARKIAMGGTGYSDNIAASLVEEEKVYTTIAVPLGIFQLVQDLDLFDPDNEEIFDPVLALGYVANPIHYGFDRETDETLNSFLSDIINADLSLDLNTYRGLSLTNHLEAEGLLSPSWGKTFKILKNTDGTFHGFYVGAWPYISSKTELDIDEDLTDVLNSSAYVPIPNRDFEIYNQSGGQLAMAITGGYRGRIGLPGRENADESGLNGIYIGMNYHYLYGFHYDDADIAFQLNTDAEGLLTLLPVVDPLSIDYLYSNSGRGFALDFGVNVIIDGWEFGFGANGVANRINWEGLTRKQFTLESVLEGGDFVEQWIPLTNTDLRVELPVQYSGNVGYTRKALTVAALISHGYQDTAFHGGAEYRLGIIEVRGGIRYGLDRWHPTAGAGLNLGKLFSIDVATFWNTTNIEREFRSNLAVSLRFNKSNASN